MQCSRYPVSSFHHTPTSYADSIIGLGDPMRSNDTISSSSTERLQFLLQALVPFAVDFHKPVDSQQEDLLRIIRKRMALDIRDIR